MNDQLSRYVFISYVKENHKEVERLCQELESHGVNVWLDRNSIKPGARWKDTIREAIRKGDYFIACFSKEYTNRTVIDCKKSYMNAELRLAIDELQEYDSNRVWFIPVLLSECDVPARSIGAGETLLDINWVPLYEDWDAGIQRILSVIKPIPSKIQNLIYAMRSEDNFLRAAAATSLGEINYEGGVIVPVLIKGLNDNWEDVRWMAAKSLGNFGPLAKAAVPALNMALKDEVSLVRKCAAEALKQINTPEAQKALEEYKQKLK